MSVTNAARPLPDPIPADSGSRWHARVWEIIHPLALIGGAVGIGYVFVLLVAGVDQVGVADWVQRFFMSPGVAGLAAVAAAIIGFIAISLQLRHNKQVERDASWWNTFEWVAERAVPTTGAGVFLDDAAVGMMRLLFASTDDVVRKRLCSAFLDRLDTLELTSAATADAESPSSSPDAQEGTPSRSQKWVKVGNIFDTDDIRSARWRETFEDYAKLTGSGSLRSFAVEARLYGFHVVEALERVAGTDFEVVSASPGTTTVWVQNAAGARIRVIASGPTLLLAAHQVLLGAASDSEAPVLLVTQTEKPDGGTKVANRAFTVRWKDESDDADLRSGVLAALAEARPQEA